MNIDLALTDPEYFERENPHDLWRWLRVEDPVHWTQGKLARGFWSVTTHAHAMAVLREPNTFSSEIGGVFLPADESMEDVAAATLGLGIAMIATDPPRHTAFRNLVADAFKPSAVARLEERCRTIVRQAFDEALQKDTFDVVDDISQKVPIAMICEMMDVPREDWPYVSRINKVITGSSDPEFMEGEAGNSFQVGFNALGDYAMGLAKERRADPRGDTFSILGTATLDGRPLTDREIKSNACQIFSAGIDTTGNTFAGGVAALLENPAEFARLRADRSLVNSAVEECLRWVSPSVHTLRTASRDVELGGRNIREGDRVVIWGPSANRDEKVFRDAERFDVGRKPNPHIAFGYGAHFCLGAHLARLELRLMLTELLDRCDQIDFAGPAEKIRSNWVAGYKTVPVRFKLAA